jgi:hypothetical protein
MKIGAFWRAIMVGVLLASVVMLTLPGPALAASYTPGYSSWSCYHIVRRGENLTWIASSHGVSVWQLANANGIHNINRIYVGQRLVIPGCSGPGPGPGPAPCPGPLPYPTFPVPQQPSCPQPYPPYPPVPPPPPGPSCSIMPVMGFGQVWYYNVGVRNALGCATAAEYSVDATQQRFQGGTILWRGDVNRFWALWRNGTWAEYDAANWYNIAGQLGWPLDGGAYVKLSIQDFANGRLLWSSASGFYALYNNSTYQYLH